MENEESKEEEISIIVKQFLNLNNFKLKLIKNGINIVVGENNTGKTKLLDYIYYKNEEWDRLNENYSSNLYKRLPLFFRFTVYAPNSKYSSEEKRLGDIEFFYILYYFDLMSSLSLAIEKAKEEKEIKKEVKFENIKSRSCKIYYTERNLEENTRLLKSVVMKELGETKKVEPLTLNYEDEEGNFSLDIDYGIRGSNPGMKTSHSFFELGSGLLKYSSLKSLIKQILEKYKIEDEETNKLGSFRYSRSEIRVPILLIDEPELLLHPFLKTEIASLIKELEENNVTTIMTTHSPAFLSHFIHNKKLNLITIRKDKNSKLFPPLYFWKLTKRIEGKIKEEYSEFARPNEKIEDAHFYKNKWRRLLNEYTLKMFFSKNVLFVEGMVEYILFNNILREIMDKELSDIEIIPIFGKFHYIFFEGIAKRLGLNYWFLLDDDRKIDEEGNSKWAVKQGIFWEKYGKNETNEAVNGIINSRKDSEFRISWFFSDVEKFLGVELNHYEEIHKCCKEYNIISRAKNILDNLDKEPEKIEELKNTISFLKTNKEKNLNND
jgi:predicted ATP-dependent endonuclease of OLD family